VFIRPADQEKNMVGKEEKWYIRGGSQKQVLLLLGHHKGEAYMPVEPFRRGTEGKRKEGKKVVFGYRDVQLEENVGNKKHSAISQEAEGVKK